LQTKEEVVGGRPLDLRVGQLVEVRSPEEILATLNENGELESLPFMPEMVQYCGQRFTVYRSAHKLCDTMTRSGMRRMENAVHLVGVRCDGGGHGGCQAACLIYWKTAWLKPVDKAPAPVDPAAPDASRLLPLVTTSSRRPPVEDGAERYACQATEILRAAPDVLPLRDLGQYIQDVRTGNANLRWTARAFLVGLFNKFQDRSARVLPPRLRFREGLRWRFLKGTATSTPSGSLDLQPGELVRVKSKEEIMKTLNPDLLNRGMGFDAEMSRWCGRVGKVARRVDHILDEKTGRMLHMKSPCIVLESVICEGAYNANCPRAITPYWREIWLERVDGPA
jgi:hypothetical protein